MTRSAHSMMIRPISLAEARRFVAAHHRHNEPPRGWLFGVGFYVQDELRAVGIAGRPVARALADGTTVEILRVCTIGDKNAASQVYGALCRAASALGYKRAVTYTLADEPGTSLRASGFHVDADLPARRHEPRSDNAARIVDRPRLFDEAKLPTGPKTRWLRQLV